MPDKKPYMRIKFTLPEDKTMTRTYKQEKDVPKAVREPDDSYPKIDDLTSELGHDQADVYLTGTVTRKRDLTKVQKIFR